MHRKIRRYTDVAAAIVVFFAFVGSARAVEMQQLMQETQRSSQIGPQLTFVWWIPQEFWQASLGANPNVTPEARTQILAVLDDYQVVALLRAKAGAVGFTDVATKDDLLSHAKFTVGDKIIAAIPPDKVSAGAQTILASLKPVLAAMLGQLGQSMQIIVYPSKQDGQRLIEPSKSGAFQYSLYEQTFNWRTPLASLLPKKVDPKTNEEFPGNYEYNPYTGGKLNSK